MRPCPNCGLSVAADKTICPNCGANLPTVWPPPPLGQPDVPAPPPERLVTGRIWGDVTLGLVVAAALSACFGLGLLVTPILWSALTACRPAFARGLGWGAVASWTLALGAIGMCFYSLSHPNP